MTSGLPLFRQHQIRRDLDRRLRQRRRSSAEPPREIYSVRSAEDIKIEAIIDPENLRLAYDKLKREGGQSPGLDGLSYDDFSRREIAAVLRQVAEAIRAGHYRPHPTRLVRIPKGDGRYRELRLATVVDRIVAKAAAEALTPALDGVLLPGVMGFRRGISVWMMLLTIIRMIGEGHYYVIAQDDIRDAFPSVRIDLALVAYRQHLPDDNLLRLVETILRGHDRDQHTVGLDQGCPLSPITLNIILDHFLDRPISADPDLPFWLRYADNIVYLCRNVSEGRRALQRARELLSQAGMTFKGQTGPPVNLRRQGARVELLGIQLRMDGDQTLLSPGQNAWEDLARHLERAHTLPRPTARAKEIVQGWLVAFTPAFENADVQDVLQRVHQVAAQAGLRELTNDRKLASQIQEAVCRWRVLSGNDGELWQDVFSRIGY